MLTFGKGNAKLGRHVFTFSLPAGWTCPGAKECLAKAARDSGKLADGPDSRFRCFSASQEAMYRNVRESRWANFEQLCAAKTTPAMARLIAEALPPKATMVRIHVSGDFFSQAYFDAWLQLALERPAVVFYAYTKSIPFWQARAHTLPANFRLTASEGGRYDVHAMRARLRTAKVVFDATMAKRAKLQIDHDDSHAQGTGPSFALLLHGTQAKGSDASKALQTLKAAGHTGYAR